MDLVGPTISPLISALIPNNRIHYLMKDWIEDELEPLLNSMDSRSEEFRRGIQQNSETHNNILIVVIIFGTLIFVLGLLGYVCYKYHNTIADRLNNAVHHVFGEMNICPPNHIPDFRV